MGFFDKVFGKQPEYPELSEESTAAKQLKAVSSDLEQLAKDVKDPLEVIPGENGAYVFIGHPPKKFGIAWIEENRVKSFKTLMEEQGLTAQQVAKLSDALREIYLRHQDVEHFQTTIAARDVIITPSKPLENDVREVLTRLQ